MERNKVFSIATQTYYESYHGKVEHLGYPKLVAGCADCHGFHNILPPDNPKSLISEGRLVETCGKCHRHANANFVQWIPHATHNDPEREPVLYGTFVLMTGLLVPSLEYFGSARSSGGERIFGKKGAEGQRDFFPSACET